MKTINKLSLFVSLLCSVTLSGCDAFGYKITELEKHEMTCTYNDYVNNNIVRMDGTPLTGSPKILVIPVWFTDSINYISLIDRNIVKEEIEKAYFGTPEELYCHSVNSYYKTLSHGQLNLTGVVSNWYECGKLSSYFYNGDDGLDRTVDLVHNAVDWYKTNNGGDLSSFDTDKNGYLDGVMLIYGSPDYSALGNDNASNMWAYCFWCQGGKDLANPTPNAFFWASYDFMYDKNNPSHYGSGDTSHCPVDTHTFIHEMGHMFGLQDYYDYSDQYSPSGGFSMQDYNVGGHDPYSALAFGWANAYVPEKTCTVELKAFQDSGDVILLSNDFIDSPFDEYLLLEYYTPTGLNQFDVQYQYKNKYPVGPRYRGIRLWHVDARLIELQARGDSHYEIARKITKGKYYTHMMSNTYYKKDHGEDYISPLGKEYANYNILQLIRNNEDETYEPNNTINSADLFYAGDSFSTRKFYKQFYKKSSLNNGTYLGWSFQVRKLDSQKAVITINMGF